MTPDRVERIVGELRLTEAFPGLVWSDSCLGYGIDGQAPGVSAVWIEVQLGSSRKRISIRDYVNRYDEYGGGVFSGVPRTPEGVAKVAAHIRSRLTNELRGLERRMGLLYASPSTPLMDALVKVWPWAELSAAIRASIEDRRVFGVDERGTWVVVGADPDRVDAVRERMSVGYTRDSTIEIDGVWYGIVIERSVL